MCPMNEAEEGKGGWGGEWRSLGKIRCERKVGGLDWTKRAETDDC